MTTYPCKKLLSRCPVGSKNLWLDLIHFNQQTVLNQWIFSLLPFQFSPQSYWEEVSEWLCGVELLAGIKPLQSSRLAALPICSSMIPQLPFSCQATTTTTILKPAPQLSPRPGRDSEQIFNCSKIPCMKKSFI